MGLAPKRLPHRSCPKVLRVDLRLGDNHPALREWASKRPYYAIKLLRNALETLLTNEGEEAFDALLHQIGAADPGSRIEVTMHAPGSSASTAPSMTTSAPEHQGNKTPGTPAGQPSRPPVLQAYDAPETVSPPVTAIESPSPPTATNIPSQTTTHAAPTPEKTPAPANSSLVESLKAIGEDAIRKRNANALLQNDAMFEGRAPRPNNENHQ